MYDYNNSSCYLGFVEPYRDLECEVVWHPGFNSSEAGEFNLCVRKGNTIKLKCFAKVTHHTTGLEKQIFLTSNFVNMFLWLSIQKYFNFM